MLLAALVEEAAEDLELAWAWAWAWAWGDRLPLAAVNTLLQSRLRGLLIRSSLLANRRSIARSACAGCS